MTRKRQTKKGLTAEDILNTPFAVRDLYLTALTVERVKARLGKSKHTIEEIDEEIKRVKAGHVI